MQIETLDDGLWKIVVQAVSAEEACAKTLPLHGNPRCHLVRDSVAGILRQIARKRARAEENPTLYADQISKYGAAEQRIHQLQDLEEDPSMTLIEAIRLNEDHRLREPGCCLVLHVSEGRWIVFGGVR